MRSRALALHWICLAVVAWFGTAQATGPSSAKIEIIPLAVNGQGVVLCKTVVQINPMGAHTLEGTEYGWLALSADGVWDEEVYRRIDAGMAEDGGRIEAVTRDYAQRMDLSHAAPSLMRMMERYGFSAGDSLGRVGDLPEVTWQGGRLCVGQKCHDQKTAQRTLKGGTSLEDGGSLTRAHFVAAGVALFANHDYTTVEGQQQGAIFGVENRFQGQDIGVELQEITGVVILPPSLRSGK